MNLPDYIDVHSHLNFSAFEADREATVKRALDAGIWIMNVGTQNDTSRKAVEIAEKYERGVYAIVGLHPIHTTKSFHDKKELGEGGKDFTSRGEIFDTTIYHSMAKNPKVVGIGECGLDYFRLKIEDLSWKKELEKQKEAFRAQIELAIEVGKPLMLHIRGAYTEAFDILNSYFLIHNSKLRANLHFFAGTLADAKKFLSIGCTLSFTGVITFARDYDEMIKNIPLDRILSETDCPYVAPTPYRGKRNEPLYVKEVVKKIADIRGEDFEKVRRQIVANAFNLFKIPLNS